MMTYDTLPIQHSTHCKNIFRRREAIIILQSNYKVRLTMTMDTYACKLVR